MQTGKQHVPLLLLEGDRLSTLRWDERYLRRENDATCGLLSDTAARSASARLRFLLP